MGHRTTRSPAGSTASPWNSTGPCCVPRARTSAQRRPPLPQLWSDVRYALRSMGKNPGHTFLVVATLAVGLAANGVIFNILDAMVVRGFDFPRADHIVRVWE